MTDIVEDKDAEIEALRAEVERLKEDLHYSNGCCDLAMKHRDEAEAENARMREALEPFRQAADEAIDESDKDEWEIWEHPCAMLIKVGHLRKATTALQGDTNGNT